MSQNSDFIITLENVIVKYPDKQGIPHTVLNDLNLRVRKGEFVTLVGPSGCGKSTMLRLILGSERPTEGLVCCDGKHIESPGRDRGIVFQKYSLFPHMTVLDNVAFGLDLEEFTLPSRYFRYLNYRKGRKKFRDRALEYLKRVGLGKDAFKYPFQLSGGMRQRVAIAQALIMRPRILLMDEPFGALDDSTRQEMQLFILEQWEESAMTIFFVTHDLEEALFLGTRIMVLSYYYSTDYGDTEGSKIVIDKEISGSHPKPFDFKYQPIFNELLEEIRQGGLNPEIRQDVAEFDLSHRDAMREMGETPSS